MVQKLQKKLFFNNELSYFKFLSPLTVHFNFGFCFLSGILQFVFCKTLLRFKTLQTSKYDTTLGNQPFASTPSPPELRHTSCSTLAPPLHLLCVSDQPHQLLFCNQRSYLSGRLKGSYLCVRCKGSLCSDRLCQTLPVPDLICLSEEIKTSFTHSCLSWVLHQILAPNNPLSKCHFDDTITSTDII